MKNTADVRGISIRLVLGLVGLGVVFGVPRALADCNFNGFADRADLEEGRSLDCDGNGIPDECDAFPLAFGEATVLMAGRPSTALATGDFDGDGLRDIAAWIRPGNSQPRLVVQLHQGDRLFTTRSRLTSRAFTALGAIDFDNDGIVDIVAVGPDGIYRTQVNGDGALSELHETPFDGSPTDLKVADLDGDGLPDVVFSDRRHDAVFVLLNQGDGSFGEATPYEAGDYPRSLLAVDIDGDRDVDIVTANSRSDDIRVLLNEGAGTFSSGVTFPVGEDPYKLVFEDFEGDGSPEIIVAGDKRVFALEYRGDALHELYEVPLEGSFAAANSLVAFDADSDDTIDLAVGYSGRGVLVLPGGSRATDVFQELYPDGTYYGLVPADFDDDGLLDIVATNLEGVQIRWGGEPRPASGFSPKDYRHTEEPHWSSIADMNGDGYLDVAVADGSASSISIQYNDGDGKLREAIEYQEAGYVNSITTADFDQDGVMDLAVTSMRNAQLIVHRRGEEPARHLYGAGDSTFFVTNGLLNGDVFPDLVTCNPGNNTVTIFLNRGNGEFQEPQSVLVGTLPQIAAPADIDGDRDFDLVIGNVGNSVSLLLNDGDGRFEEGDRIRIAGMRSVAPVDLDSDGDPDLVVTHSSSRVLLFENRGGEFVDRDFLTMGRPPSWVIPADLNQDGIVDLITSNTDRGPTWPPSGNTDARNGSITMFIGTGPFAFEEPRSMDVGADPRALHAVDLDGDDLQDILVINHDSRTLSVILNRTRTRTRGPFVDSLCTEAEFFELSIPARGGSRQRILKFVTPEDPDDETLLPTMYQNVRLEPLHQEFLADNFPERFPRLTRDAYDALVHRRATRDYFVGNLFLLRAGGRTFYGFSVITGAFDDSSELPRLEEVTQVFENLSATFGLRDLVYYPETNAERESASRFIDAPFEIYLEKPDPDFDYEAYTQGVTYGRVRVLDPEAFAEANRGGRFGFQDIVVLSESPRDIEGVVAGVITATEQTAASHVAVRTARRGTPNAYIVDAVEVFSEVEGELIRLEVDARDYSWRAATSAEAEEWWETHRRTVSEQPSVDESYRELPSLAEIALDDKISATARVGGKAANFARLQRVLDGDFEKYRADGFAIPHHYYLEFLRSNRTFSFVRPLQVVTYEEYIDEIFASEKFQSDSSFRFDALERLRDAMVEGGEVSPELVARVAARVEEVFGETTSNVRMRSSSNAEDALEFNGAGLYNSFSACAADDLDDDDDGPSECSENGGEENERGVARALKRVWRSLWNFRAHEERAFYSIPHDSLSMGILVTRAFSDELANGVVFTADPGDPFDRRYQVSVQAGERSVVSPEPGELAELDLLEVPSGAVRRIVRAVRSSVVAEGAFVLSDEQLEELGALVWHIDTRLDIELGDYDRDRVLLDIEFKFDQEGRLAIKQVRPFLTNEPSEAAPEFALEVAEDAGVCASFLEFRSPHDTWRLKSDLEFRAGKVALPTTKSFFSGPRLFDRLRLGPERRVAQTAESGIYRLAKDAADASSFTFSYEQEFELEDGTIFPVVLDGLTFRSSDQENGAFVLDGDSIEGFVSLQGNLDGAIVKYGSCSYESLRLWEIEVGLADGSSVRLLERHEPPLAITETNPALLIEAEVAIRGVERTVSDYWNLVYTAARHNLTVEYWVVFDPPLVVDGIDVPVRAIEIVAPEPSLGVRASATYLDERFAFIEGVGVRSFDRREAGKEAGEFFRRGDVDSDGTVSLTDAVRLLDHLFLQGAEPTCRSAGDVNDDGLLNLSDAVTVLDHLFRGVASLPAPFDVCGSDRTEDELDCEAFSSCR